MRDKKEKKIKKKLSKPVKKKSAFLRFRERSIEKPLTAMQKALEKVKK